MAVFCGVCATQLYDATENEGSFKVATAFINGPVPGRITDTCEDCAAKLRAAVAVEATRIATTEQPRILALKTCIAAWNKAEEDQKRERREFEEAWRNRKK